MKGWVLFTPAPQRNGWDDPATAARRANKQAVVVDGVRYKSVHAAFRALDLPESRVRPFRVRLKRSGRLKEFGHTFVMEVNH